MQHSRDLPNASVYFGSPADLRSAKEKCKIRKFEENKNKCTCQLPLIIKQTE